jgi:hypothetical protein
MRRRRAADKGRARSRAGGGSVGITRVSGAGESHPRALPEPDVNLSAHPAPSIQPCSNGFALVMRLLPSPVGRLPWQDAAAPSVQSHYRTFTPTTGCPVPVPRIGTLALVGASRLSVSLGVGTTGSRVPQQSLIRVHAASKPGAARAGLQGAVRTCPGGHYLPPGFDTVLRISARHQRFACARLSGSHLTGSSPAFSATLTTNALDASSSQRFGARA